MDIRLFGQNLIIILCMVMSVSSALTWSHLSKKWRSTHGVYVLIACFIVALLITLAVRLSFPGDKLPDFFLLMVLPVALGIGQLVVSWRHKQSWVVGVSVIALLSGTLFSLAIINGYYRFYPDIYSVFGIVNTKQLGVSALATTVHLSDQQPSYKSFPTIEGSLYQSPETNGSIYSVSIPGIKSRFPARKAWAYEPALAAGPSKVNLPVIVLTSGLPGAPENWVGAGLKDIMDQFASHHHGITPYVFVVDETGSAFNDTECVDSPRGNAETYLSQDVPQYIKAHYEVSTDPSSWAIGGLSLGGMCSVMLSLRHPDAYRNFIDLGGEIGPEVGSKQVTIAKLFHGSEQAWSEHQPLELLQAGNKAYQSMGGFLVIGSGDKRSLIDDMKTLDDGLKTAGLDTVFEQVGGHHTFSVWADGYKDALPWISNRLGATDCISSTLHCVGH